MNLCFWASGINRSGKYLTSHSSSCPSSRSCCGVSTADPLLTAHPPSIWLLHQSISKSGVHSILSILCCTQAFPSSNCHLFDCMWIWCVFSYDMKITSLQDITGTVARASILSRYTSLISNCLVYFSRHLLSFKRKVKSVSYLFIFSLST